MQVNVTFRHLDSSDALKAFARDKVEHIKKFLDHASEASVILTVEKHMHHAEVLVHSGPFFLRGREKSDDMYASIGMAVDKIEKQIKRHKSRMRQHRPAGHHNEKALRVRQAIIEAEPVAEAAEAPAPSKIVESKELLAKRMTVDEAITQIELLENDFLVFTNAETSHVAVLYRRKGENSYGLIDARSAG